MAFDDLIFFSYKFNSLKEGEDEIDHLKVISLR